MILPPLRGTVAVTTESALPSTVPATATPATAAREADLQGDGAGVGRGISWPVVVLFLLPAIALYV